MAQISNDPEVAFSTACHQFEGEAANDKDHVIKPVFSALNAGIRGIVLRNRLLCLPSWHDERQQEGTTVVVPSVVGDARALAGTQWPMRRWRSPIDTVFGQFTKRCATKPVWPRTASLRYIWLSWSLSRNNVYVGGS